MVRVLEQEHRIFHFRGIHENANATGGGGAAAARHAKSYSADNAVAVDDDHYHETSTNVPGHGGSRPPKSPRDDVPPAALEKLSQEIEQMKERFAKLLLGEDMSGGSKGVGSALALSNAITNLAASVFGEQTRLVPMAPETRARWRREIDLLLSVTDYIVELVPSQQKNKDGTHMEIMTTKQRTDLQMNIPALRKLDAMLLDILDQFKDQNEFSYVSKDASDSEKGDTKRRDDKWWLPTVKIPPSGLSEQTRKFLQYQKDCVNQVLKAAMAINAQALAEMQIPENYIESLPKNGRSTLGDQIYKSITVEFFDPDQFLSTMDLSADLKILDLKNKIEASIVIWRRKMNQKDSKSAWSSAVSIEKRELFEERAETILLILKQHFPGIPQSSLDISKIQFNKDVGQSVLESYSRILESLAYTVLSRIDDVLNADQITRNTPKKVQSRNPSRAPSQKVTTPQEETERLSTDTAMTLSDFMGWNYDQNDADVEYEILDSDKLTDDKKFGQKLPEVVTNKKPSYLESLGGLRSPVARH